jgi:hypothetical protein
MSLRVSMFSLVSQTLAVRKGLYEFLLNAGQSGAANATYQLVRDLYAILVETTNHKIAPSSEDPAPPTLIILFDQAGFPARVLTESGFMSFTGNISLVASLGRAGLTCFPSTLRTRSPNRTLSVTSLSLQLTMIVVDICGGSLSAVAYSA